MRRILSMMVPALFALTGCGPGPRDMFSDQQSDDTMVVISLPTQNHVQQDAAAALEEGRIVKDRFKYTMKVHDYGRGLGDFQYVGDQMVIFVSRSPASIEMLKDPYGTGENPEDEAFEVSTLDGIKMSMGVVLSGVIDEKDAKKYVFYYGVVPEDGKNNQVISDDTHFARDEKLKNFDENERILYQAGLIDGDKKRIPYVTYTFRAKPLTEVLRKHVAGYCEGKLSAKFNGLPLEAAKEKKTEFFKEVLEEAKGFFKERGITLTVFDYKGSRFENLEVQKIIDARFGAQNALNFALEDEALLEKTNKRKIDEAKADRDAAIQFIANYPAMRQELEIELRKIAAERADILRLGWDGKLPVNVLPSGRNGGNPFILDIRK